MTFEEQSVPPAHQAPQSRVPVPGREVPIPSGWENQWRLWVSEMEGCCSPIHHSLKAHAWTYSVMNSLALSSSTEAIA